MSMFQNLESAIFFLFIAGIVSTSIELFVPGFGVFGAIGVLSTVISIVLTLLYVPYGAFIVAIEIVILIVFCYCIFKFLKKKHLYGKLILNDTLEDSEKHEETLDLKAFLGKEGVSKTALKPFGFADFDGVSIEVTSDSFYINSDKRIKVINIANNKIIVKEI